MRLVHFLTFVLLTPLVLASPDSTISPSKINSGPKSPWQNEGETLIASRNDIPHSLTLGFGLMIGPLVDQGENRSSSFVGISQTNQNHTLTAQDYGIELSQIGMVGAHWFFRTPLYIGRVYDAFYQLGAGALFKPQEGLGSFINYERYQARAGCGFENFLNFNRKLRVETQAALSPLGFSLFLALGYNFPD
jgi:hypothetical protein